MKDTELFSYLQNLVSYNLFEKLASAFILSMVPQGNLREEDHDQKKKIAWTFEMTSRLSALDLHPMNRTMGFGAKYVHQHFAPWIQQHGGWVRAESCTVIGVHKYNNFRNAVIKCIVCVWMTSNNECHYNQSLSIPTTGKCFQI